ncbi:MAG: EamA family transporter RarD [Burkholderiales bacterium]|nr:MAG: EamA family transporter RarD [Burkholderiales bacterium]
MNRGIAYASAAYLLWGVFPVYFKALQGVAPLEILGHRIVWSLLVCAALLLLLRRFQWLADLRRQPRVLLWFTATSVLVAVNWFVYIWAVNAGRVVDASLGYFINPLVNVLFGALLLHERLRRAQWLAVGIAAAGVAWLTWQAGTVPWIGLVLAVSFGLYGLLRKTAALGALEGLALETLLLAPVAAAYLVWLAHSASSGFVDGGTATRLLLLAAGPVTAVPLLLFAAGARRIPFSTLGLLQYLGPSLQLLLGVWLYGEPFAARAPGYLLIWIALAVFSIENLVQGWRARAAAP